MPTPLQLWIVAWIHCGCSPDLASCRWIQSPFEALKNWCTQDGINRRRVVDRRHAIVCWVPNTNIRQEIFLLRISKRRHLFRLLEKGTYRRRLICSNLLFCFVEVHFVHPGIMCAVPSLEDSVTAHPSKNYHQNQHHQQQQQLYQDLHKHSSNISRETYPAWKLL